MPRIGRSAPIHENKRPSRKVQNWHASCYAGVIMGREKRARLLVPSLVFVAAAAACGGTSIGELPAEPSGAGAAGRVGGHGNTAGVSSNPPPIGYGGQVHTTPAPVTGGYGSGGYGNEAGDGPTPPPITACPTRPPVNGRPCTSAASYCEYGTGNACAATIAWCDSGSWSVGAYTIDCSEVGGASGGPPIAEAGAAGEAPTTPDATVYCPQTVPTLGAYCYKPSSVTSYRCDYAVPCGAYQATCDGQWQLSFHGLPPDSCVAGSPGI